MVFQKRDHERERDDPDHGPQHLLGGAGVVAATELVVDQVEPVDHHQAKSVEQRHDRQQQRIGIGGEAPDGQVCATRIRA